MWSTSFFKASCSDDFGLSLMNWSAIADTIAAFSSKLSLWASISFTCALNSFSEPVWLYASSEWKHVFSDTFVPINILVNVSAINPTANPVPSPARVPAIISDFRGSIIMLTNTSPLPSSASFTAVSIPLAATSDIVFAADDADTFTVKSSAWWVIYVATAPAAAPEAAPAIPLAATNSLLYFSSPNNAVFNEWSFFWFCNPINSITFFVSYSLNVCPVTFCNILRTCSNSLRSPSTWSFTVASAPCQSFKASLIGCKL